MSDNSGQFAALEPLVHHESELEPMRLAPASSPATPWRGRLRRIAREAVGLTEEGNFVSSAQGAYLHGSSDVGRSVVRRAITSFQDSLLGAGALAVIDQSIVSGTSFCTSVIIGRTCSPEELGVYSLALSIMLFLLGNQNRTVIAPYAVYCGRRKGVEADWYAGSVLAQQLALTMLGLAALLGIAGVVSLGAGPTGLKPVLWILLGAAPLMLLRQFARDFAFSHLQLRKAIAIDATVAVLQVGGLLALARWHALSVETAFTVIAVACAIASLGWIVTKEQTFLVSRARLLRDWLHNWSFARWTCASHLIGSASVYLMPWVIVVSHGEGATGKLAACWSLAGLANLFVCGVDDFLTPKAARAFIDGGAGKLRRVLRWAAALFVVTVGTIFLVFLACGGQLVTFVYGEEFSGMGAVVSIFVLSVLVRSLGMVAGNGLWALERPNMNFAADVFTFATTLGSAVCLVPPLGVLGAALATLAGATVGAIFKGMGLRQVLASGVGDVEPVSKWAGSSSEG